MSQRSTIIWGIPGFWGKVVSLIPLLRVVCSGREKEQAQDEGMGKGTSKPRGLREVGAGRREELQKNSTSNSWAWLHWCLSETCPWMTPFGLYLNRNLYPGAETLYDQRQYARTTFSKT